MAGDKENPSATAEIKSLHPVYSVTNIQNKIRVLDGVKVTYSSWVKLFKLHARGYKVLNHIDGTPAPVRTDPTYESWSEVDAIVLQWIYGTLSDDFLVRVLDTDSSAQQVWNKIQAIFLNNKGSRAAALEHEFTNLTLAAYSSMDENCQKLKDLADQLDDIDHPVSELRRILQLVQGLPPEFNALATYINQAPTTWDNARSMIQLEQNLQKAREKSSQSALVTQASQTPTGQPTAGHYSHSGPFSQQQRGRGRGRNRGGRGNYGRGRSQNNSYNPWAGWNGPPPPPCPHPTQPSWPNTWNNKPTTGQSPATFAAQAVQPYYTAQHSPSAHMAFAPSDFSPAQAPHGFSAQMPSGFSAQPSANPLCPTELGVALQAVQLNTPDQTWYMDWGASSHITADPGPSNWNTPFSP